MSGRPEPTWAVHFTRVENLPGIIAEGLACDSLARAADMTRVDIGAADIKARRRSKAVAIPPGGCVGDYVPFYFAPRSPMMFTLSRGNYGYSDGFNGVIYLCITLEEVLAADLACIVSDRNAARAIATFRDARDSLDDHVDWPLMREQIWRRTDDDPDRPDRRAAELLVHQRLPFELVGHIVARNEDTAALARDHIAASGSEVTVDVRPAWYF